MTTGVSYPKAVSRIASLLSRLPGIGSKSAMRIALHMIRCDREFLRDLGASISAIPESIVHCAVCHNISDASPCATCSDARRDRGTVCVVENSQDIAPVEKSGEYHGLYHVLGGALSPIDSVMPEDLRISELIDRVGREEVHEVILATNLTPEGEATATYIASLLKDRPVRVTRIAHGLPLGADLEYSDEISVGRAIRGRREA